MVSRCFPGGYNVKLYISRGRLAWWLLVVLHSVQICNDVLIYCSYWAKYIIIVHCTSTRSLQGDVLTYVLYVLLDVNLLGNLSYA